VRVRPLPRAPRRDHSTSREIGSEAGGRRISPAWASMTLVLAAGCVGFHRFFGFSSV
jgi:hypothetical protein